MTPQQELRKLANPKIAEHSQRFFKTGPGEYGEGDIFLGVRVPKIREVAKRHRDLSLAKNSQLLKSKYHEERLLALVILTLQYAKAKDEKTREFIYKHYVKHFSHINNWDLVDTSSHKIVGPHLENTNRKQLYTWAKSKNIWVRRISIIATFHFIKKEDLSDAYKLSEVLLNDKEDLIHKAVGWVLREMGKKDLSLLKKFLDKYAHKMPRTMLRYSLEKMTPRQRQIYMKKQN